MQDFRKLIAWQKAHALRTEVAPVARATRRSSLPDLARQIERTAGSICWNIAEGRSSDTDRTFAQFLGYAIRSASELEAQLLEAEALQICPQDSAALIARTIEVRKILIGLRKKLRASGR
jgi:four helix bundle protein